MARVKVYRPRVSCKIVKLVKRDAAGLAQRFTGAEREIDLSPLLGEGAGLKILKSVQEQSGGWQMLLTDQIDQSIRDSIYSRIEPMDLIEIRGSRTPHLYAGRELPLIMRGFVDSVRRGEAFGQDSEPRRSVVIAGRDSGKLWNIFRLFSEAIYGDPRFSQFLDTFRLQAATGIDVAFLPVAEMLRQLTDRVINARVAEMASYTDQIIRPFNTSRLTVQDGVVSIGLVSPFQGAYWDLAEYVADRPWNEIFIEDEEDGPYLVHRPAPYKGIDGQFIMRGAVDPGTIEMADEDVISIDVARSDARVANFFFTPPGASLLDASRQAHVANVMQGTPFDREYANNHPQLYGLRKMTHESRLLPALAYTPAEAPQGERGQVSNNIVEWHVQRGQDLKMCNRDNSILEEGSMQAKGSETYRPGRFLRLTRGSLVSEYYVTRVSHEISPLDSWTSTLTLERGMGFLERMKTPGAPFWAEGRKGAYG